MSTPTASRHAEISCRMILQANYETDQLGDRVQASEKAAEAVPTPSSPSAGTATGGMAPTTCGGKSLTWLQTNSNGPT